MAELQYEDSESEESEEDEEMESDDPLWALYSYVRHYETPSGVKLYEPFLTLPSKRELPDYFVAIPDPISLNLIRKKLKAGEYANQLTELADDLNTMFENCKTYNRPDSRLYKEGAKLQKMMNQRLEELEMDDDEDDSMAGGGGGVVSTPVPVSRSPPKSTTLTSPREALKKRLRTLYNAVLRHRNREGIEIIGLFMEKPSKRDYPDYYEVILNPMDMNTIEGRIKNDVYKTEDEFMSDIKLMFTNCRKYNEEGSDIYEDANVLERVLMTKAREMGLTVSRKAGRKRSTMKPAEKIKSLFDLLRDHKDSKGRQLSLIFLRLPNPKEFPDYFEVIKNPIDFEKVNAKLKQNAYSGVEECLSDFMLMFDNASKYNEPDSQIYKDALNLQSLAGRIARNMHDADDSGIPDVQIAVQELLNYIFISMYNHRDSDERSYSDSLTEVAEHDESEGKKIRALSLDLIKRRLDRGLYKRLVVFQRDVFTVLERARNLSRSDSQVFEDAVELQVNFIKFRDDACANGDVLQSKALLYTLADLQKAVEEQKAQKVLLEQPEEAEPQQQQAEGESSSSGDTATFNQQEYRIGEFVYAENTDNKASEPFIYLIENIFTKKDGETMVYGNRFFRPIETFHVSTRKFLEKEVFRSDLHSMVSVSAIAGRCIVVPVRDYYRSKPNGFEEKDTYVCESRYTSKAKTFKKMKLFWTPPEHIKMALRDEPLEMKRVMSVFKERIEKHKEELDEIEAMVRTVEEELPPNVLWNCPDGEVLPHQVNEERTYYEQYTIPGPITLRRGDMVYVRSENGKNLIAQIDTMWTSAEE
jgi:protein polybromo-1